MSETTQSLRIENITEREFPLFYTKIQEAGLTLGGDVSLDFVNDRGAGILTVRFGQGVEPYKDDVTEAYNRFRQEVGEGYTGTLNL